MLSPLAGKPAPYKELIDVASLISDYYECQPDCSLANQKVSFGISGHRGSAFKNSFNEAHVFAMTQAVAVTIRSEKLENHSSRQL